MSISAEALLAPLGIPAGGVAGVAVSGLALDSRTVRPGDLFLACAGSRRHGLEYLAEAMARGAVGVLWEPEPGVAPPSANLPAQPVEGLGRRLGEIADRFFGEPSRRLRVIGVTGTDGKSSCAHFIAQALDGEAGRCGVIGTLGHGFPDHLFPSSHTTPDPVRLQRLLAEMVDVGATHVAMEVSSHALDQGRVNGVRFHAALLTNLTRDHLDYHGDVTAYHETKRRLFRWPGLALRVIDLEEENARPWMEEAGPPLLGYGLARHGWQGDAVIGHDLRAGADGLRLRMETPLGERELRLRLLGRFNALNALGVAAVLLGMGLGLDEVVESLQRLHTVPGRMEHFGGGDRPLVVVDYAHTPEALRQALSALREHTTGRLWCLFGAGGDRDRGKRPLMGEAAEALADRLVVTDDNPRCEDPAAIVADILAGMQRPERVVVEHDRARALALVLEEARPGDTVLVAGKGHEEYQVIGDRRLPLSDRQLVSAWLAERAS